MDGIHQQVIGIFGWKYHADRFFMDGSPLQEEQNHLADGTESITNGISGLVRINCGCLQLSSLDDYRSSLFSTGDYCNSVVCHLPHQSFSSK